MLKMGTDGKDRIPPEATDEVCKVSPHAPVNGRWGLLHAALLRAAVEGGGRMSLG